MTMLSDWEILKRVEKEGMIRPFTDHQVSVSEDGHRVVSYGLSSYGYDCRLSHKFKVFTNIRSKMVDPKDFNESCFEEINADPDKHEHEKVIIPPNSFALGVSLERFQIPRDIIVICLGKSTYARCGIIVSVTPLEPEWEGHITIEVSNTSPLPAIIYPLEGICQLIFLKNPTDNVCTQSYKDKRGKYQGQGDEIVLPRV
jgi:dCTP deaminase